MTKQQNFSTIKQVLLDQGVSKRMAFDCINILEGMVITELLKQKQLNHQDIDEILQIAKKQEVATYYHDTGALITVISHLARDQSHGAAKLTKVLISNDTRSKLIERHRLGKNYSGLLNVGKSLVLGCEMPNNIVIGLCESKFNFLPIDKLIIKGKIDNA